MQSAVNYDTRSCYSRRGTANTLGKTEHGDSRSGNKYNKGEFTQEDYLTLADAYNRAGYIRKQRDMLEQDYRLYADEEAFAALQEMSVKVEEETEGNRGRKCKMIWS